MEIEPPDLPTDDEDDDDNPIYTGVHVGIFEADGTRRAGYGGVPGIAADEDLADSLIDALRAAAAARSPGLVAAIARRIRGDP